MNVDKVSIITVICPKTAVVGDIARSITWRVSSTLKYAFPHPASMESKPSVLMTAVRSKGPLVHHITNYVTVNDCANICICSGGSPVMTDALEDVVDMVSVADALVLNIGTLNTRVNRSMLTAGKVAREHGVPIVFDPVGMGATPFRTSTVLEIIRRVRPDVIKGNQGEMGVLSGIGGDVKGVDSQGASGDMAGIVSCIADRYGCIAAATGVCDYVSDGDSVVRLSNGHDLLGAVTGTGCMVSSVVGCYVGADQPSVDSVSTAISAFNISAEYAAKASNGPGTFKPALMDAMYNLSSADLDSGIRREML